MRSVTNIKEVRENLLGYRFDAVARFAGISPDRLRAIEEHGVELSVFEADALARVYGVDAEILAEQPIRLTMGDTLEVLAQQAEFHDVSDEVRRRIVGAANAARDLEQLRERRMRADRLARFRAEIPRLSRARPSLSAHRQGAVHARELRQALGLKLAPIPSLRDLIATSFPSLNVLYSDLGDDGPAGITFADHLRGPTLILNVAGRNANPCVRRFSLAHELYHLLVDWATRAEPLALLSGFLNESRLEQERRANAFAVRFLCPEAILKRLPASVDSAEASKILGKYGLSYATVRLYLRNEANKELPLVPSAELTAALAESSWAGSESPRGVDNFPVRDVPPERRTLIASAAASAYAEGLISRGRFAEVLGVTPAAELDLVLNYFALNPPAA